MRFTGSYNLYKTVHHRGLSAHPAGLAGTGWHSATQHARTRQVLQVELQLLFAVCAEFRGCILPLFLKPA